MKNTILHLARPSVLRASIPALVCIVVSTLGYASPEPSTGVHFCLPLDLDEMQARDSIYAANKQALNLNVGPPRTVRMIYFLPNDRPFRASVVDSMKKTIRQIQTFYGEQMQAHGYGYKTFAVESDASGEPIVHRVDGQHPDSHYLDNTSSQVPLEIHEAFDRDANIYLIVVDNSNNAIGTSRGRRAGGTGSARGKVGGHALVHGAFSFRTAAHELGHAFGLKHDFSDDSFIMSYGRGNRRALSMCSAGFLSVHAYFNSDVPIEGESETGFGGLVELISSREYPTDSKRVLIQLNVSDSEGIHLVIMFVRTRESHPAVGSLEVKACRLLDGQRNANFTFDYNGVFPSDGGTSLSNPARHEIYVQTVDLEGNMRGAFFTLIEISAELIGILSHSDEVASVAFSPDGAFIASGSNGGTVELWNVATQTNIGTFGSGRSVAFSPDFRVLATGGTAGGTIGTINLWDLTTRNQIKMLSHGRWVETIAISSNGETIVSVSNRGLGHDNTIELWSLTDGKHIGSLGRHDGWVTTVAFAPDNTTLASGSLEEGTIKLWDVSTRKHVGTLSDVDVIVSSIRSVAFSPNGRILASGSGSGYVYHLLNLWDTTTRKHIASLRSYRWSSVRSVSFSPNGTTLAAGTSGGSVELWDVATRMPIATLAGHTREVSSVTFSHDGRILASGSEDKTIRLWDVSEWTSATPHPRTLQIISGNNQQSSTGLALANPFVVEVRDQNGNPLPGVPVRIVVTEGNGKLSGKFNVQNTTTDATGRAQITLTLGLDPGKNAVEVSVEGSVARIEETFYAEGIGSPTTPNADRDYKTWHLPNGTIARLGKGSISGTVAFSPDGRTLAVSGGIGVWLYDVATQNELSLFTGHQGTVRSVAFSPDGTMLVSGSSSTFSGTLKLWDVSTGRDIATFGGNRTWRQAIHSVAYSPDGNSIAAGSYGEVNLWDVASKTKIATLVGHVRWVNSVAYSPDGKMLAAGLNDDKVALWDIAARTKTTLTHEGFVGSVAFSPDGRTLASAGTGIVKLWDVATRTVVTALRNTYGPVAFSPDGIMLFAGNKLWDVNTTIVHATFDVQAGSVTFSPNGRTLATTAHEEVRLWDIKTQNSVKITHSSRVGSVAFSPDGNTLAAGAKLWDVKTQSNFATLQGDGRAVAFLTDGTAVLIGNKLWDLGTRTILVTFPASFHSAAVSPNGKTIASGGTGSTVKLWDVATRQNTATLDGHTGDFNSGAVQAVAFSPDGTILASGSRDKTVKLWDVSSRTNIATLEGHRKTVESVAFSPDGETLVSGSRDGSVRFWNVSTRQNTATFRHGIYVMTVAFSPDGSTVASGIAETTIKLWDVAAARSIATLEGHSGWVLSIAFSPDGELLASGSSDGTVLLWDTSSYGIGATSDATFSFSLDANIAVGNQRVPTLDVATGSVVPIQLFGNDIRGVNGVSARFEYDATQVGYDGFDPGSLLPNAQVLAVPGTNPTAIDISVVSFGGQVAVDSGMVGSVRFRTTDGFSGTTLLLVSAEIGRGDQREKLTLSDTGVMLRLAQATPDFNGDGRVDFGDFVAFGMHFGASRGDARYEAKYDLDQDGMIGFGDFLIFGQEFGT